LSTLGIARESFHGAIAQLPHVPTPQAQARTGAGYQWALHNTLPHNTPLSQPSTYFFGTVLWGQICGSRPPMKLLKSPQLQLLKVKKGVAPKGDLLTGL